MRARLAGSAIAFLLCSCTGSTAELQCPAAKTGQMEGVLGETPAQIAAAGERLGRGSENEVAEVAANVRRAHLGASNGAVVNYLITAYCPKIKADPSLSRAEKQDALQSFSARAEKIVGS